MSDAGVIPLSCGHHQRDLAAFIVPDGGRLVPSGGLVAGCDFYDERLEGGHPRRCGCFSDWIGVTGSFRRAIAKYGRVHSEVVDTLLRRAVREGRDPLEILALAAEARRLKGLSWAAALRVVGGKPTLDEEPRP